MRKKGGVQVLQNTGVHSERRRPDNSQTFIIKILNSHNCVLFAESVNELQQMINIFHTAMLRLSPSVMIEGEELEAQ